MAENKKAVLLYCDIIHTVEELSDEEAGRLFKHYLRYINDKNPVAPDKLTRLMFEPIKQHLKRDLQKWEEKREARSEAGKKGMAKRWDNNVINPITKITVNGNVKGKVNVIEKDTSFTIEHCLTVALNDPRWVNANAVTEKELKEFNRLLEKRGIYEKNPFDYKTHFANWKATGKKDIPKEIKTEYKNGLELLKKYE